ncbi:hypothetical protein [Rhodohalobacter sp.]|uniref:hypothetical protein n=1 Tax=Rhodohalobacter sp. TaxID=1974210 RepID=UPI0035668A35
MGNWISYVYITSQMNQTSTFAAHHIQPGLSGRFVQKPINITIIGAQEVRYPILQTNEYLTVLLHLEQSKLSTSVCLQILCIYRCMGDSSK